ncbi:MAG: hypothetical protein GY816_14285 [Cytophagales bacterium]|nr:hypothetical protein [Cytophagales bacterium]
MSVKQRRRKQQPVRALLPAHLPRQEEIIEPEELEEGMKKIGEEVIKILEHTPTICPPYCASQVSQR